MFTEFSSSATPLARTGSGRGPLFPEGANPLARSLQVESPAGTLHVDLTFRMHLTGLPLDELMEERR
jgi:hypothetical protein